MRSRRLLSQAAVSVVAAAVLSPGVAHAQPELRMIFKAGDSARIDFNWRDVDGTAGGFGRLDGYGLWSVPGTEGTREGWKYSGALIGGDAPGGTSGDPPGLWTLEWECVFSELAEGRAGGGGLYVTGSIVIMNADLISDQAFFLQIMAPTDTIPNPLERGSVVGTITDLTFDDATVSAAPDSQIYTPMIDGDHEPPGFLFPDPFQASAGGPLMSASVGPADFGLPTHVSATQQVDNNIGVLLAFDLTPGDVVSFTSIYEVRSGALPLWDCGDGDGIVGAGDFLALIAQWGTVGSCDFDGAGVGVTDLLTLLANWAE